MADLEEKVSEVKQFGPDIVIIIILVMICVIPFSSCPAYSVTLREPVIYEPEITNIMKFPPSRQVPADFDIIIYAKITDKYSDIKNATLTYADDRENNSRSVKMKLINGTYSNGTFRGTVPKYSNGYYGTNISYTLSFSDGLNYRSKYSDSFVVDKNTSPPKVDYYGNRYTTFIQGYNTTLNFEASDYESGIRNATFYYHTVPPTLNSSVIMELVDGKKWHGIYEAIIPSLDINPYYYTLSSSFKVYDLINQSVLRIRILITIRPGGRKF